MTSDDEKEKAIATSPKEGQEDDRAEKEAAFAEYCALHVKIRQLREARKRLESAKLVRDIERKFMADVKREKEERDLDEVRDKLMCEMEDEHGYSHYWYEAQIAYANERAEEWRSFLDGKFKEMVAAMLAELSKGVEEDRIVKEHAENAAAALREAARYPADP